MAHETIDESRLHEFLGQAVADLGAAWSATLVLIGERLGLYRAMAAAGPLTPAELAERTGTSERYVSEWLANQAAGGYVTYEPETGTFRLPPEQALVLADESAPVYLPPAFQAVEALAHDEPAVREAFRSGGGIGWHDHHPSLFDMTERFFRPGYRAHLVSDWLPALDGVVEKLEEGARVADVGCGHGASTLIMAEAFPSSEFVGFDFHPASIEAAEASARRSGLNGRVRFDVAPATAYGGGPYDLVTHFDCLHDMGDPTGAAHHTRETLADDGTWMIVEPFAHDRLEDNLTPVGRIYFAASTQVCTPCSLAQDVGRALGAQAGEARLAEVIRGGGFASVRRAAETPFNLVLEARPSA
jgi:SAM-dependent methyltransferase